MKGTVKTLRFFAWPLAQMLGIATLFYFGTLVLDGLTKMVIFSDYAISFCFLFCGRIMKKYMIANIAIRRIHIMLPPPGAAAGACKNTVIKFIKYSFLVFNTQQRYQFFANLPSFFN